MKVLALARWLLIQAFRVCSPPESDFCQLLPQLSKTNPSN